MHSENQPLWIRVPARGEARRRLFCFPYAGGSPSAFMKFAPALDSHTELLLLQLPGHGERLGEPTAVEVMPLLSEIGRDTRRFDDLPAVFFGHSLGAILAFETARRCRSPWLKGLIVSGCIAPSFWPTARGRRLATLGDVQIIEALREYQGFPEELLADDSLLDMFLPVFRADFSLVASYEYQSEIPLPHPVLVFAGANDPHVDQKLLAHWQQESERKIVVEILQGNHFFFSQHVDAITARASGFFQAGHVANEEQGKEFFI